MSTAERRRSQNAVAVINASRKKGVSDDYRSENHQEQIGLAFRETPADTTVCFATNLPPLMLYGTDLFTLYGRRWNIETRFGVIKHKFMARTTSREYKIPMFLFLFSQLLYNVWIIVNASLNRILYGVQEELRLISAKLFVLKFYQAYMDYVHPPDDV
jgi:IS4 transposase